MNKLRVYDFLKSNSLNVTLIKLSIISIIILMGCLYQHLMLLALLISAMFIVIGNDIRSFSLVLALYPYFNIFSLPYFSLSCWNILVIIFFFIQIIKLLIKVIKKEHKINLPVMILTGIFIVYLFLPIYKDYSIFVVLKALIWVSLGILLFENKSGIEIKEIVISFIFMLTVSYLISLLRGVLPYLQNVYSYFYAYDKVRFAGLMGNPNQFYQLVIIAVFSLIYLLYTKQLKIFYSVLFLPLFIMGWLTLSRAFIISLVIIMVMFLILCLIKFNKSNLIMVGSIFIILIATSLLCFPYTKCYFARINSETQTDSIPSTGDYSSSETPGDIPSIGFTEVEFTEEDIEKDPSIQLLRSSRMDIYKYYIEKIKEPKTLLFGVGLSTAAIQSNTMNAHNTVLQGVYTVGVFGVLLILAIIILVFINLFKDIKFKFDKMLLILIGFVAVFACFMIENHFLTKLGFIQIFFAFLCLIDYYKLNKLEKINGNLHT